ncbi:GNAT family N-acetyltransferase [Halobacillus sp. A1]|uniref:GNAT family N-acetyltransferase n=1 Tax=Halobacillus sp. A1 TaxID=2880262 RepID=UPI0020A65B84|nr:GNAT family N-acetyltransferase [Halobacillus sp. A1]MCP3031859.1 GNAT family N-acetyltransferase [Halobacillus sp. A1]
MWYKKAFEELTKDELHRIFQERVKVFVVEQTCYYQEVDGQDDDCLHIWKEENGRIVTYCRIVPPVKDGDSYSIGRVLVEKESRGRGLGREIMERAIHIIIEEIGAKTIALHAQDYLRNFYRSFGFEEMTDVYLEDDIPHVDMLMHVR